jgi:hypothetical protein
VITGICDVFHGDADAIRKRGVSLTQALLDAKADGLVLLIAKCTEGGDGPQSGAPYIDPAFADWVDAAASAGVALGTYHVGTDSQDGAGQAAFYDRTLRAHGIDPATSLCVLDREPNNPPMSPLHAEQFVTAWRAATNRWPVYYRNLGSTHGDYVNPASPSLKLCQIWLAAYGDFGKLGPKVPWWIWQYCGAESDLTEGPADLATFPRTIAGLGKTDRSAFHGTADELLAALATIGA